MQLAAGTVSVRVQTAARPRRTVRRALSNRSPAYSYGSWSYWGLLSEAGEATAAVPRKRAGCLGRPRWFCTVLDQIFNETNSSFAVLFTAGTYKKGLNLSVRRVAHAHCLTSPRGSQDVPMEPHPLEKWPEHRREHGHSGL